MRKITLSSLIRISLRVKKLSMTDKIDFIWDWDDIIHVVSFMKAVSGIDADNDRSVRAVTWELQE